MRTMQGGCGVSPLAAFVLLASLLFQACSSSNPIQLPSGGDWTATVVDSSDKNSGMDDGMGGGPTELGYINYQPIATQKGLHLSLAAAAIRAKNATLALALQNAAALPASQSAFNGQDAVAQAMGSFLAYHGGKVYTAPTQLKVYLLFYGANWSRRQKTIISRFVYSLDVAAMGGYKAYPTVAGWWGINTHFYYGKSGAKVTPSVTVGGIINDRGSMAPFGTALNPLTQNHIRILVQRYVDPRRARHFPVDPNGAYVVLTSSEIHVADFCQGLCAYHSSATFSGAKLSYIYVGDPAVQCPMYCTYKYYDPMYVPPNGDMGADACSDKLGHELAELTTNPLQGPYDTPGWVIGGSKIENADMCEWEYGNVVFENNGVVWNMKGLNNTRYLIQLNYQPNTRKCVLQWNSK